MPNSNYVDERVVRMRMDNEQFEKGAERTMGTIEKLKKSLKFNTSDSEIGGLNTSLLEKSIDKIEGKFNALQVAGRRMVENLTDGVMNLAKQAITGADQITPGFRKYEDQVAAIQKLMIATGKSMEDVQKISDKILTFTDETSYEYNSMLSTMSAFTSSGVDMETAADTIIGMAVAAGQAGVNAKDATHAFMGFQKAIASGYMGSAQWDWIRTAGMNSAELKKQLLEAAVATGDLQKGADGVYYAIKGTSKGAQQIAVSVENFEQSFANKWLSGEAIEMAMGKYSKAFDQIMEIHEKTGAKIFEIIGEDSPYLQYIDEYGLAAFKAGQETKTWSDAMEALKSAMSSGWMKSFELIIGNYKQASGFFSDLIEPLYQIFVNPGNKRNKFLEAAFGGGGAITKTVANWDKLKTKLEGTGKSMKDFEEAYAKYVLDTKDASLLALIDDYGSLEAAIRAGAISGEQLNGILNNIAGVTTEATDAMVEGAVDATAALEQYKEAAIAVLRGDYGGGQERRDALEAMGLDYDTVQWLAGNLENGKGFDAITLEWFSSTAPNAYQHFIDVVGSGNPVINSATGELIALGDVTDELTEKINQMSGRELWQGSVLNVVTALADAFDAVGEAFDNVFGSAEVRGKGFRGILERIYRLTLKLTEETEDGLQTSGTLLNRVRSAAESIFKALKAIGTPIKNVLKILKTIRTVAFALIDKVLSIFTGSKSINSKFGSLSSIIEKIGIILTGLFDILGKIFKTSGDGIDGVINKINKFSFREFFKPVTDFLQGDSPIAKMLRTLAAPFIQLFSGEGSIGDKIKEFFDSLKRGSDDTTKSFGELQDSIGGLDNTLTRLVSLGDIVDGDSATLKDKLRNFWDVFKNVVAEEYKKINWDTVLSAGKMGLIGYLIYKFNDLFFGLNKAVKALNTNGPLGSLRLLVTNITAPFTALSKAIAKAAAVQRFIGIAVAIGILAGSIYLLTQVGDTQAFFNAVVSIGVLLYMMSKIAKNLEGSSLFSNNTKSVSKNNPITNTIKAFENLKSAFSADFTNAKLNINVFSNVAQILIAFAIAIVAIVHAFNQIRDIQRLEDVQPALIILVGIMSILTIFVGLMAKASGVMQHGMSMALLLISFAVTIRMIVNTLVALTDTFSGYDESAARPFVAALMSTIGAFIMIIGALLLLTFMPNFSGSAIIGIAATILAVGIVIHSIVKTIGMASKIENAWDGIAIIASIMLGVVALLTIMSALAGHGLAVRPMVQVATSMLILSVAIGILVPAVLLLAALPKEGLIGAGIAILAIAAALVILGAGLTVMVGQLQGVSAGKVIAVIAILLSLALVFTMMSFGITSFITGMVGLSQLPWVQMKADFQAMHDVLAPELPLFLGLGLAALALGVGLFGAAAAGGIFGLSFLAIAAGIYIVAAALPMLIDGIIYVMDQLQENGWKIVGFIGLVLSAILLVMLLRKAEFIKVIASYAEGILTVLQNSVFLKKLLVTLGTILIAALTFLRAITPEMVDKVIQILVTFINSLADSIRSNKEGIISAIYNLIEALLELVWEALIQGLGTLGKIGIKLKQWLGDRGIGQGIITAQALDADHIDIISDTSGLEEKAAATAKEDRQKVDDAYTSALSENSESSFDEFDLEEAANLSDEDMDKWFAAMGIPESDNLETSATEKGTSDAQLAQESYYNGMMSALGGGDLTNMFGGGGEGTFGTDASSFLGGNFTFGEGNSLGGLGGNVASFLTGNLGGDEAMNAAGESGTNVIGGFIGKLTSGLTDGLNIESMMNGLRGFFGNTIGGEETTTMFNDGGTNLAITTVDATATEMQSQVSYDTLFAAAQFDNNAVMDGWNQQSDVNAPIMAGYMISGLELSMYNDPTLSERLKLIGEHIYHQVERGMRSAAGIASPSKAMAQNGIYLMQGLMNGITDGSEQVYGTADVVTGSLLNSFQNAMAQMLSMINADMSLQPTITPVVDMHNVDSAVTDMNSKFNGYYNAAAETAGRIQVANPRSQRNNLDQPVNNFRQADSAAGGITVNVYPSEGMDEKALADKVIFRLSEINQRRRASET